MVKKIYTEKDNEKWKKRRVKELREKHHGKAIRCWELEQLEEQGY